MKFLTIFLLIITTYEITPFRTGTLSETTSCEKVFLDYKEEQKDYFLQLEILKMMKIK